MTAAPSQSLLLFCLFAALFPTVLIIGCKGTLFVFVECTLEGFQLLCDGSYMLSLFHIWSGCFTENTHSISCRILLHHVIVRLLVMFV